MTRYRFTGDDKPPPDWKRYAEVVWLFGRLWHGFGHLDARGPEDGPPAIVIPGFLATDRTCMELRRALAARGWRTYPWDLGLNRGAHADVLRHLRQRLEVIHDGRPVLLVGWSLGGIYARELAREAPEMVRAVVTLGSPFSGDPHQNNVWHLYEWIAGHPVDAPPVMHHPEKPPVPTLAIWSRRDGIVARRAARGLEGERDKEVEIGCSHMAFGISRRATRRAAREIGKFLFDVEGKSPAESQD
jgi:pimeloyl-ACP methyl ester carboxylesterase